MIYFTDSKPITDMTSCPFQGDDIAYLLVSEDNGHYIQAYLLSPDCPLDIEELLSVVYCDNGYTVQTTRQNGGSNYAAIITDSRPPDSVVVWSSCDFYIDSEEY